MSKNWIALVVAALLAAVSIAQLIVLHEMRHARREERTPASPSPAEPHASRPNQIESERPTSSPIPSRSLTTAFSPTLLYSQPDVQAQQPATPTHASTPASAQPSSPISQSDVVQTSSGPLALQLNLDFTTAYFYHGIVQEDTGLIIQPSVRLTVNLYQQGDLKVDALVGVWNSLQGQKTGASTSGDFSEYWYEADVMAGFVITKDKFALTTTYTFLTSPSDAFQTVQELDLTLAFDDTELLGKFALRPYALLGIETGADASDGADSDTGVYLELGIAPGFTFDVGRTPVSLSFPAAIGLSLSDYYQDAAGDDDTFGFAQVGVKASLPLPFGERYGNWTLNAGVSALFLGDNTSEYNGGDRQQFIGIIGLQVNF